MQSPAPLGHLLLERSLINQITLDKALSLQRNSNDRLGDIFLSHGMIGSLDLYQTLARHYTLPFVNLDRSPPDPSLQNSSLLNDYITYQTVPFAYGADGTLILATSNPSHRLTVWAKKHYGKHRLVITSPLDISRYLQRRFAAVLDAYSRFALWNLSPEFSARILYSSAKKWILILFCFLILFLCSLFPVLVANNLFLILNLFYGVTLLFKARLFFKGKKSVSQSAPNPLSVCLEDRDLPIYTILVPLHDEAEILPRLLSALDAIDYPKAKLDIKLILEESDHSTFNALKKLRPHGGYEIILVPYSLPQTKPKACNYAMHFAKGEYVTIYDAEDKPDPGQLRKAVSYFCHAPKTLACLQARLNYENRSDSWLTKCFTLEYTLWFDYFLPGLQKSQMPIPLGGTSNHLRVSDLRQLGGWDPFNVTEDADLGIRLARHGKTTMMLDSLTEELAPKELAIWLNQRTRWIRGYMQTWIVHMRHPVALYHGMSLRAFLGFQFFIGGPCLQFLTAPFLWLFFLAGKFGFGFIYETPWLYGLTLFNLLFGYFSHAGYAIRILLTYQWKDMWKTAIFFPLYWFLHSVAAYRALWQLFKNPHLWEKTPHKITPFSVLSLDSSSQYR